MTVSKKQLVDGVIQFIGHELITQVGDRNMKFVLAMAKDSLRENPDLADEFLQSPMISSIVTENDGMYNISPLSTILRNVLSEYQTFTITIPKIPLFSPTEKTVKISAEDVDKLMKYIMPAAESAVTEA